MKFLVISDTHGHIINAVELIESEKPDYVIHLGDMVDDCEDLERIFPRQKFIFVKGNNDFWTRDGRFPEERVFSICDKKFFVCHGHKFHVKGGLYALTARARSENADIVLYGHTHAKYLDIGDMIIMNPGSYSSCGIIEISDNGEIKAELKCI